ncbi:hypothetical protein ASwh1_355 [Aeromonas phage Aswh_1]|nr:hypothetical protein ASwh1_355 [Aeromonas phage Aswh_1]
MNIEIRKMKNTNGLFGLFQESVWVDGSMMFYISWSDITDDWRLFSVPEDNQLTLKIRELTGGRNITNFDVMVEAIKTHINELLEEKTLNTRIYMLNCLKKSGLVCGIFDENYGYGSIEFNSPVSSGKRFTKKEIEYLVENNKFDKDPNIFEVFSINMITGAREVVFRGSNE